MKTLIYIFFCLLSFQVFAQEPVWMHLDNYSPYNLDYSRIGVDHLNNIYTVSDWMNGYNFERASRITKYSPDGNVNWTLNYQADSTNTRSVYINEDGTTYITRTISMSYLDQYSIVIAIDNNGNEIFTSTNNDVNYNAIICDDIGNVYVSGHSFEAGCEDKAVLAKFNSDGELLWQYCWDEPCNYSSGRLLVINDSNLFVIGKFSTNQISSLFIAKYSFNGDLIDHVLFNISWETKILHKAIMDEDNNIYVLGRYDGDGDWMYKGFIYKFDSMMTEVWHDTTSLPDKLFTDFAIDDDKNLILSGYEIYDYSSQPHATYAKYDQEGNKLWHYSNDSIKSRINSITTYNNNYFLTGRIRNEDKYSYEYYMMRLNSEGEVIDTHILESVDSTYNVGVDNVIDHNSNLISTGIYEDDVEQCLTLKYDAITFEEEIFANNQNEFINVYPNPAKTILNIDLNHIDMIPTDILIYSLDGRIVKEVTVVEFEICNHIQVDLDGITNGIYFLSFKYPDKVITEKVIITD